MAHNSAISESTVRRRYNAAMQIEDLPFRMTKLLSVTTALCWHGHYWQLAFDEYNRLSTMGIKPSFYNTLKK